LCRVGRRLTLLTHSLTYQHELCEVKTGADVVNVLVLCALVLSVNENLMMKTLL